MKQTMSDNKAINISKLIDYHREIQNQLGGEVGAELSAEIDLIQGCQGNLGCQSASKAEQQLLRGLDKLDPGMIDV